MKQSHLAIAIASVAAAVALVALYSCGILGYSYSGSNDETQLAATPGYGDSLVQSICKSVSVDYPNWKINAEPVVAWQDKDGSFHMRMSPEGASFSLGSPSEPDELVDLEIVGVDKVGYAGQGDGFKIGVLQLDAGNSVIYESPDSYYVRDVSFIDEDEFVVLYVHGNKAVVERISPEISEKVFEFDAADSGEQRVSVSPNGRFLYILYPHETGTLTVIDMLSMQVVHQADASEAVWVGSNNLVYKSGEFLIYDFIANEAYPISSISGSGLSFNPAGVISYTSGFGQDSSAYVVDCSDWSVIAHKEKSQSEALADYQTLMLTGYTEALNGFGYWRFNNDWGVRLSIEGPDSFYSGDAFATLWSCY